MRRSQPLTTTACVLLCLALAGCGPTGPDDAGPATPPAEAATPAPAAAADPEPTHLVAGSPFSMPDLECTDLVPFLGNHVDLHDLVDSYRDEDKLRCDWRKNPQHMDATGTQVASVRILTSDDDVADIDKRVASPIGGFTRPEALVPFGGSLHWLDDGTEGFHGGTGSIDLPGLSIDVAGIGYEPGTGMTPEDALSVALAIVGR